MKKKIRVGILFGGKSAEHEISLISAKNVIHAMDQSKYELILIGIDKQGEWHIRDASAYLTHAHDPQKIALHASQGHVALVPQKEQKSLVSLSNPQLREPIDVIFPILHGTYGEDGTVQGLLKMADIPFVGASVLGSAVGMDKDVMKRLLRDAQLPIAKFITLPTYAPPDLARIRQEIGYPCFVKPANLGSSVGVHKVKEEKELKAALEDAFQYDRKILIEEYISGREIECSVLGNDHPIASLPGEVIPQHEFYSYEAKYLDEQGALLEIPAKVSAEITLRIQDLALKAYKTLCCEGMARVDFFLKENGEVLINEINTIPGFTQISMYPKMWQASGLSYADLIDRLIELALERHEKEKRLRISRA